MQPIDISRAFYAEHTSSAQKYRTEASMADRETIITDGSGGGSLGTGMIAVLILVLVLLFAGGYLVINHGSSPSSVTVDVPKVTVNTPPKS